MARILLVEDDIKLRSMVWHALTFNGHNVIEAGDGREAIRLLPQVEAEPLITDIVMPEMEGLEPLIAMRSRRSSVKVIAVSGGGRTNPDANLRTARHLGAAKVLAKPFTMEMRCKAISDLLPGCAESAPQADERNPG
jgi:DNA-binding NtrC family response regulator